MILSPKIKNWAFLEIEDSKDCHRHHTIGFWAIFGAPRVVFAKLPKILTLLLKLHTQKMICSYLLVLAIIFGPRIKNPWCYENLQVISTRLYQLIWILLFYGAIFKTNKMKQNFEKKKT